MCFSKMCHSFVVLLLYLEWILVGTYNFILNVGHPQVMHFLEIVQLCLSVQLVSHKMHCNFAQFFYIRWNKNFFYIYMHMSHLLNRRQGFKWWSNSCWWFLQYGSWYRPTALSLDTESVRTLAIPLICCSLTHLGIAGASRPHVLHFSLSVCPVKILSNGLWS